MDTDGKFYLGRIYDPKQGKTSDQPLLYDLDDLTTHAVVVGMTGSGKTGLCIGLLEEAALNNIPALMIDPKGDITNTLLHFPNLLPSDFQPWVNPDQARRARQTVEQAAEAAASSWKKGLADWNIAPDRLQALSKAASFAVYTPGSTSGIPVSILASLQAPEIPWEDNQELLREKISGTVTALLGLVGFQDLDPVRSREHILLSNIFEHAWSQGRDLDLGELILQTQNPPFPKLGVFDVNSFFPEKDRFSLAMSLNSILAAPAFQSWIQGKPLDIASLLYEPDGRPQHSVFYIAHLNDEERMFFVTLLFSAVEAWMRSQSGTTTLRAIVYFDEIFGYLPPVSNPPSKQPMLRMLKQARAFGVGLVLVTQNPVDLDYKGLSNTGTWCIGKLQTDQDKQRLLDGLQGALAGAMDRSEYDRLLSGLGKRVFLMNNVHEGKPQLFQTRWAMNYLAGPLTRTQIPALNQLVGAVPPKEVAAEPAVSAPAEVVPAAAPAKPAAPAARKAPASPAPSVVSSTTRPAVPAGVDEYFLPNNLTLTQAFKAANRDYPSEAKSQGLVYRPVVLAQARIRFLNRTYKLDFEQPQVALVPEPDRRGAVRWENFPAAPVELRQLDEKPDPGARFGVLEAPLSDAKLMSAMQKDFVDWAYRTTQVTLRSNPALKLYAGPDVSQAEFRQTCADAARKGRDAELKKVSDTFDKKIDALQEKIAREERELEQDEAEHSQRKMEEFGSAAETLISMFGGRRSSRRISGSLTKRRMTAQSRADVQESKEAIAEYERQIQEIEQEKAAAAEDVNQRWGDIANQVEEMSLSPAKKDVLLDLFGVAWMPYHIVQIGDATIELPGYGE